MTTMLYDLDNQAPVSQEEREKKVFNLTVELTEAQRERKTLMKAHTENIKRIKSEIKDLVEPEVEAAEV